MTVCPGQRRPDSMGVKTYLRFFELLNKLLHCVVSNLHGCHNLYCLHQNLPQYFRRDYVADCIFDYLDYFADHVADVFGLFCHNLVADVFLMKIVDVETIQDQICMFQDSVPAGSYNDPFLSSVISMVAPTWCHGAI